MNLKIIFSMTRNAGKNYQLLNKFNKQVTDYSIIK